MKKLFAIFAVAAVMSACTGGEGQQATDAAAKPDSSNPAADAQKIADTATKMLDTAKTKAGAMLDTAASKAGAMMDKAKEGVKDAANKVAEGAKQAGKEVKEAGTKAVEKVKDAVKH